MFVKLGKVCKIYAKKMMIFNMWCETIRKLVLISDFHDEYQVLK